MVIHLFRAYVAKLKLKKILVENWRTCPFGLLTDPLPDRLVVVHRIVFLSRLPYIRIRNVKMVTWLCARC